MSCSMKRNKLSIMDVVIEILCLLMLIGTTLYLILGWQSFPEQVPMHSNFVGEIDRWGQKGEMLILPIFSWIMYIFITVVGQFPQVWNTGVKVTVENRVRVYRILKNMIGTIKIIIIALFSYMTVTTSLAMKLPVWFTIVTLVLVFGDLAFWLVKLYRNC